MKKLVNDFKEFALGTNVLELAIGVIMGGAASKMVSSLVDSILMPIIGIFLGGKDFSALSYTFGNAVIKYGAFIQSVVDFLIITLCIFFMTKGINTVRKKFIKEKEEAKTEEPKKPSTEDYLKEIRDLMVKMENSTEK